MRELSAKLKPAGLLLTESVPIEDPAYDLEQLARFEDYLLPMVYDEHYQSGEPGPIASADWFRGQLERLVKILPPEKTLIGLGTYGYDWQIGGSGSEEVIFGRVISLRGFQPRAYTVGRGHGQSGAPLSGRRAAA